MRSRSIFCWGWEFPQNSQKNTEFNQEEFLQNHGQQNHFFTAEETSRSVDLKIILLSMIL